MNNEQTLWAPDMQAPITQAIGDGVIEGIKDFVLKNQLKTDAGTQHTAPLNEFVMRLTAEMQEEDSKAIYKRSYPFKVSLREEWEKILNEIHPVLVQLWLKGDTHSAIVLARTTSYLETFKFLEENRKEIIPEYNRIRGGDMVPDEE